MTFGISAKSGQDSVPRVKRQLFLDREKLPEVKSFTILNAVPYCARTSNSCFLNIRALGVRIRVGDVAAHCTAITARPVAAFWSSEDGQGGHDLRR